jgi:DNA-binding phage protein
MATASGLTKELRKVVAREFRRVIDERFPSAAKAADDLGISRQRLQKYLDRKATPHSDLLLLAMKKWGIRLQCFEVEFSQGAFQGKTAEEAPGPQQLDLFDEPLTLRSERVELRLARKGEDSLRITLAVKLAS